MWWVLLHLRSLQEKPPILFKRSCCLLQTQSSVQFESFPTAPAQTEASRGIFGYNGSTTTFLYLKSQAGPKEYVAYILNPPQLPKHCSGCLLFILLSQILKEECLSSGEVSVALLHLLHWQTGDISSSHSTCGGLRCQAPCILLLWEEDPKGEFGSTHVACIHSPILLRRCRAPCPLLMHLLQFLSLSNFPRLTFSLK